jgi:hypothetical protein
MTDEVRVRTGTPEDLDSIMELALKVAKENGVFAPNIDKVLSEIWPALHRHQGIVGVIGEPGGTLEGFALLRIGQQWYNNMEILEERVVYVDQKFRSAKGGRARKLYEFCKHTSDVLELPLIVGVLSSTRTEGKTRLLRRLFGPEVGAFWWHGPKTGSWHTEDATTQGSEASLG